MKEETIKIALSLIGGMILSFSQKHAAIIILVLAAIIFDTVTGIVATLAEGKKLDSARGTIGFWKKVALILALAFGCFLDVFVPYCMSQIDIAMPRIMCFGMMFGCYIILNESISIMENLNRSNPEILPAWVIGLITEMKDKIEHEGNSEELHRSNREENENEKIRD